MRCRKSNSAMRHVLHPSRPNSPESRAVGLLLLHILPSHSFKCIFSPRQSHISFAKAVALLSSHQMFKILTLNCLISMYALSIQYLNRIKYGDYQVTITGMLMSVYFLCISHASVVQCHILELVHSRDNPITQPAEKQANDCWKIPSIYMCSCWAYSCL